MSNISKIKKTWIPQSELLSRYSISRTRLFMWQREWVDQGRDLREMGKLPRMARENLWDQKIFNKWVYRHRASLPIKYDYEKAEQDKIKKAVAVINLNNQIEGVI